MKSELVFGITAFVFASPIGLIVLFGKLNKPNFNVLWGLLLLILGMSGMIVFYSMHENSPYTSYDFTFQESEGRIYIGRSYYPIFMGMAALSLIFGTILTSVGLARGQK